MANHATVTWKEGNLFEGTAVGHTLQMGSVDVNGPPQGIGPMNLLLVALGGCTAMDIISILEKARQDVTGLTVEVTGERADDYPKVYKDIQVVFKVRGRGLARHAVERAVRLSEDKYCSVGIMLGKSAHLTTRIETEEEK